MFIDLHTLRTKIKIRNTTTSSFFTLFNTNNKYVILNILIEKKKRRMRILSASIFLSFLAGKLRHFEQLLLIASKNKFKENWRMRILSTPYFF